MKMVDSVFKTVDKYPDKIAYDFMGKKVNYATLKKQINRASAALSELGVKRGDIICIMMPNVPQAVICLYAANNIGAIVNMIHPLSSEVEIQDYVTRMKAKTILVLDQFYEKVDNIRSQTELEHIIVASVADVLPLAKKVGYKLTSGRKIKSPKSGNGVILWNDFCNTNAVYQGDNAENTDNDIALILYSGGTTGKVKGVCLSNKNVNDSAQQMIDATPMLSPDDRFLTVMPIFHGNGLVIGVHSMLKFGARCVLIPRFTPESYAKDLIKNKCNYTSGVPALYERLMDTKAMQKADLSFLKGVFSGADYLSAELEQKLNAFFKAHNSNVPIRQGYGMTEGVVAAIISPYDDPRSGSIGKPLPGVLAKIVKPDTDEEMPVNEVGEIVFSSTANMVGYYENEEETAKVKKLHSDGREWIHSGDLGSMDEDGFFYFKGRIKRMIVTNGYNVFPNELENTISSFPMVKQCCIIGVPYREGTEKVKAFIVLKDGTPKTDEIKNEIRELCKKNISYYAVPKMIEFIDEMPKTKVGKVDYKVLLEKSISNQ